MWQKLLAVSTAVAALTLLSACGSDQPTSATDDDCTAKLEFEGTVYTFRQEAATSPPTAGNIDGQADVLGCDGRVVDTAVPVEIEGVPTDVAVSIVDEWPGVYVAEGADVNSWPDALKR